MISRNIVNALTLSGLTEIGVLVTLATGLLVVNSGSLLSARFWDYGFPFAWKEAISSGSIGSVSLNWYAFLFDDIFYMAAGYIALAFTRGVRRGWPVKPSPVFLLAAGYLIVAMAWFALIAWANAHWQRGAF